MKVTVYTSRGCSYCERIKNDLREWGIEDFEEKNVSENPDYFDELHDEGIFTTPVTKVDDNAIVGYRPNKMKDLLGVEA
ncbi:glutaredoxin family protein [Caldalkalibacillus salinus]|uniref:glutaredoxin family protein n=1 Tax=Caldalkalibacillus salinus TaxID=2803787 RepID=UPI001F439ED6|nr:glutaredoxin family protein [Caldalkalibacillus salinus]